MNRFKMWWQRTFQKQPVMKPPIMYGPAPASVQTAFGNFAHIPTLPAGVHETEPITRIVH